MEISCLEFHEHLFARERERESNIERTASNTLFQVSDNDNNIRPL